MKLFASTLISIALTITQFSMLFAQATGPEQDAEYAILICDTFIHQPIGYSGGGRVKDIPDNTNCLTNEENNSVWYKFHIAESGKIVFTITPLQNDDYDFAIYNTTGVSPTLIRTDTLPSVRCSYSATIGPTGLSYTETLTNAGVADPVFLAALDVVAGERYHLVIDNFNTGGGGYTINFAGSTAKLGNPNEIGITEAYTVLCDEDTSIIVNFITTIDVSTISSGEFEIIGSTQIEVLTVTPLIDGDNLCKSIKLKVSGDFIHNSSYNILLTNGSDGNTIAPIENFCSVFFISSTTPIDNSTFYNYEPVYCDFSYLKASPSIAFYNNTTNATNYLWHFGDGNYSNDANPSHQYSNGGNIPVCLTASNTCFQKKKCKNIIFNSNTISGRVYAEDNFDCLYQPTEVSQVNHILTAQPGPTYAASNAFGTYTLHVDVGNFIVKQIIPNKYRRPLTQYCPYNADYYNVVFNNNNTNQFTTANFGNIVPPCQYLTISYGSQSAIICEEYKGYFQVCNEGNATAYNVYATIIAPNEITITNITAANAGYSSNGVEFNIDSIKPNQCFNYNVTGTVDCIQGFIPPVCFKTEVFPKNNCDERNGEWDGANLRISSTCLDNNMIKFEIINQSTADMQDSTNYKVYTEQGITHFGKLKLSANQSMYITHPATNNIVRCEVEQTMFNPTSSFVYFTQFPCSNINQEILSSEKTIHAASINDENPETFVECISIIGAYDPNDKQVSPSGFGDMNLTASQERLHYKIRFQNTGTSYANDVVITDTISKLFDISTLKLGARSHPYIYNIESGLNGNYVFIFTFKNIYLPDSTTNLEASMGFISYSIKAKANIPNLSVVTNNADIFFDYNPPIRTNTVFNTLGELMPQPMAAKIEIEHNNPRILDIINELVVSLTPNPAKEYISLSINTLQAFDADLKIFSIDGKLIQNETLVLNSEAKTISLNNYSNGVYIAQINVSGRIINKKIIIAR